MNAVDYRSSTIAWEETGNPLEPYRARIGGNLLGIRVNDFPDEPLYTLLVDGQPSEDFDDWPAAWKRPGVQS